MGQIGAVIPWQGRLPSMYIPFATLMLPCWKNPMYWVPLGASPFLGLHGGWGTKGTNKPINKHEKISNKIEKKIYGRRR